jgi:hypothetical protein
MPHQNSHIQFGKDLFSNSIYSSKICLIIYNFFYLISLGYAAPYPCHPLAPSMRNMYAASWVLPICVSAVAARGVMHGEAGPIPPYAAASRARVQQRCNRGQRHGRATDSGTSGGCCAVAGHGPYALTIKLA